MFTSCQNVQLRISSCTLKASETKTKPRSELLSVPSALFWSRRLVARPGLLKFNATALILAAPHRARPKRDGVRSWKLGRPFTELEKELQKPEYLMSGVQRSQWSCSNPSAITVSLRRKQTYTSCEGARGLQTCKFISKMEKRWYFIWFCIEINQIPQLYSLLLEV